MRRPVRRSLQRRGILDVCVVSQSGAVMNVHGAGLRGSISSSSSLGFLSSPPRLGLSQPSLQKERGLSEVQRAKNLQEFTSQEFTTQELSPTQARHARPPSKRNESSPQTVQEQANGKVPTSKPSEPSDSRTRSTQNNLQAQETLREEELQKRRDQGKLLKADINEARNAGTHTRSATALARAHGSEPHQTVHEVSSAPKATEDSKKGVTDPVVKEGEETWLRDRVLAAIVILLFFLTIFLGVKVALRTCTGVKAAEAAADVSSGGADKKASGRDADLRARRSSPEARRVRRHARRAGSRDASKGGSRSRRSTAARSPSRGADRHARPSRGAEASTGDVDGRAGGRGSQAEPGSTPMSLKERCRKLMSLRGDRLSMPCISQASSHLRSSRASAEPAAKAQRRREDQEEVRHRGVADSSSSEDKTARWRRREERRKASRPEEGETDKGTQDGRARDEWDISDSFCDRLDAKLVDRSRHVERSRSSRSAKHVEETSMLSAPTFGHRQ